MWMTLKELKANNELFCSLTDKKLQNWLGKNKDVESQTVNRFVHGNHVRFTLWKLPNDFQVTKEMFEI